MCVCVCVRKKGIFIIRQFLLSALLDHYTNTSHSRLAYGCALRQCVGSRWKWSKAYYLYFFHLFCVCFDCNGDEIACENIHTDKWKKRLCLLIQIMFMYPLSELMRASFDARPRGNVLNALGRDQQYIKSYARWGTGYAVKIALKNKQLWVIKMGTPWGSRSTNLSTGEYFRHFWRKKRAQLWAQSQYGCVFFIAFAIHNNGTKVFAAIWCRLN